MNVDVLSNVSFSWKDILKQVDLWTMERTKFTVKGMDIKWSLLPSGYPTCQAVDLTESFDLNTQTPMIFGFKFFPRENLGISLQIEDRNYRPTPYPSQDRQRTLGCSVEIS